MSKLKKTDLGKGIAALLGNIEEEVNQGPEAVKEVVRELSHSVAMIPVEQVEVILGNHATNLMKPLCKS